MSVDPAALDLGTLVPRRIRATQSLVVTPELTVAHTVPSLPPVFATPQTIHFMEVVSTGLLAQYLPKGWVSVGIHVDVAHLAATPIGLTVVGRAEILNIEKRQITFAVDAHNGVESIGLGVHQRTVVHKQRFIERVNRKKAQEISDFKPA